MRHDEVPPCKKGVWMQCYNITQNYTEPGKPKNSRKTKERKNDYMCKAIQKVMMEGLKNSKKERRKCASEEKNKDREKMKNNKTQNKKLKKLKKQPKTD
jgi:hypothetical protein